MIDRRSIFTAIPLVVAVIVLSACASNGPETRYLSAIEQPDLTLPPDLVRPQEAELFKLPEAFLTPASGNRDEIPVLAQLETARLQGSGDFYWLEVDVPVETLYPLVRQFWGNQGYQLSVDEPAIGIMETQWLYQELGVNREDASWFDSLFANDDYTAVQDQFHTRIERFGENDIGSRVYIAHRGTEYQQEELNLQTDESAPISWFFREPEPELEVEMLSRLLVFLGTEQSEADNQVTAAKMFNPRATRLFDSDLLADYLLINESVFLAWNKVYHILQRSEYVIEGSDEPSGFLTTEGYVRVEMETVEEEGGFFSIFGSGEPSKRSIDVMISEESNQVSRLRLEDTQGETDLGAEGDALFEFLFEKLR